MAPSPEPAAAPALVAPEPTPVPGPVAAHPAAPDQAEEPVTGKYRPLFDYLSAVSSGADRVELGFSDIGALVTGGLPKSASNRTWWGNTRSSRQARAWLSAGFDVAGVDLGARVVRFERRQG